MNFEFMTIDTPLPPCMPFPRALTGFPVSSTAKVMYRNSMTVKRSLNELETAGLIMRVRQGVGEPNRIYVLIPGKEDAALA